MYLLFDVFKCQIANAVIWLKSSTQLSAMKGFHIYDLNIQISVHADCIDSIYPESLVV